jgi:hypothetical protein
MGLIIQNAWRTGETILPALLAQFLPHGCCAHCESTGSPTREETLQRQYGRLPGSGFEWWFMSRWSAAQRGNTMETQWA